MPRRAPSFPTAAGDAVVLPLGGSARPALTSWNDSEGDFSLACFSSLGVIAKTNSTTSS